VVAPDGQQEMQLRHLQARLRCLRISASARSIQTRARGPQDPDSLLIIPGIGRAAQEKLANRDVNGVKKLCQLFVDKHARDKEALVSFLAVGVRNWLECLGLFSPGFVSERLTVGLSAMPYIRASDMPLSPGFLPHDTALGAHRSDLHLVYIAISPTTTRLGTCDICGDWWTAADHIVWMLRLSTSVHLYE
jgi:hypothetical protein